MVSTRKMETFLFPGAGCITRWHQIDRYEAFFIQNEMFSQAGCSYYLETIGCDPDFQGKGYGSAVIQPVLNRCDDNGLPAYLENTKENNLHFYERFGFHITDTFTIPKNGPSIWLMWREPGKF